MTKLQTDIAYTHDTIKINYEMINLTTVIYNNAIRR